MKKKEDELLNSNYDGIQEYDNDLPRWWKALFLITIVYGLVYVLIEFTSNTSSEAKLQEQLKAIQAQNQAAPTKKTDSSILLTFAKNSDHLAKGKAVFDGKCAACHGQQGQGLVGPNLTDKFWIHGGLITDIRRIVEEGVADKGMLSWKGLLSSEEMDDVSAYIFSLAGTNPPNPKAPQGVEVPAS